MALLRHTSHQDKAETLTNYIHDLEAGSNIVLNRAGQLLERGWQIVPGPPPGGRLRLLHPRLFYKGDLLANGDPEFWLKRVRRPHRIGAQETKAFIDYIDAID